MKDLIKRQAVLDLINENWYASNGFYLNHIMEIPSIEDISIRHGKWIQISPAKIMTIAHMEGQSAEKR